ncbi:nucleotidyl transferase AbiEii/AbiGii toxin family protein [Rhizobium sp. ZW T2_16]|uniref:nucleotidyl transferase AbiEii/AbiGii toxin family protein n=1 Tax=Rhizobium sp. ZW T2_16 TaxID=3378083 RepID=UPI000F903154
MAEQFLQLSRDDRREVLAIAAEKAGRPIHLLKKDTWVVWALQTLYGTTLGDHLVFKGGTSLSKAYNAIRRFSEDVDLTYDIRELAHKDPPCENPSCGDSMSTAETTVPTAPDEFVGIVMRPLKREKIL